MTRKQAIKHIIKTVDGLEVEETNYHKYGLDRTNINTVILAGIELASVLTSEKGRLSNTELEAIIVFNCMVKDNLTEQIEYRKILLKKLQQNI